MTGRSRRYDRVAPQNGHFSTVESINAPQYREFTLTVSLMTICWTAGLAGGRQVDPWGRRTHGRWIVT